MDILQEALNGFSIVFEPMNLLYCFLGALIGMLIGVLPGLGPMATISILLPITYTIDPVPAIIMLAGIFYGAQYGGTITSVLLKMPGESTTVITAIDGYQMAKQGRAGSALGISAVGSFIGGTVSVLGLTFLAPVLASVALDFGPPEYAALALLGILLVSTLGSGSVLKSLMAALLGLLLATVGQDAFTGSARFTFDSVALLDGIDFIPIAMGLFGLGEIFYNLERRIPVNFATSKFGRAWPTMADWLESRWAVARGTVAGFFLGILPGGGATLASMVSYAVEKKVSKKPETFGTGNISGVAGPETSNNAAATSSFIPLLTLGIPANGTMAVMLGALLLQGVAVGPQLISQEPELFWGVISSMWLGNIFLLIMAVPMIGLFVRILRVRSTILAPLTVMVTLVGVYSIRNNSFDILIAVIFGVFGYLLKKLAFDPAPLILAFILGGMLENAARQSLVMFDGNPAGFLGRPISAVLLLVMVVILAASPVMRMFEKKIEAEVEAPASEEKATS